MGALALCLLLACGTTPAATTAALPPEVSTATPSPAPSPIPTLSPVELRAIELMELREAFLESKNKLAAGAWFSADCLTAPGFSGDGCFDASALPSDAEKVFGGLFAFAYINEGRISLVGSALGSRAELEAIADAEAAAIGANHMLVLHEDGSVSAFGSNLFGKCETGSWTEVLEVEAGLHHSVGRRWDGTLVTAGDNSYGQCEVLNWRAVTDIASGLNHTVGLFSDGTVLAVGDNSYGQCEVQEWEDIIAVYCGANYTVGLRSDFTLVAAGDNSDGQCELESFADVTGVACGIWHTAILQGDGRVSFCGVNTNGQFGEEAPLQSAGEVILGLDTLSGPWTYVSQTAGVLICYDTSLETTPIRADLFAPYGHLPFGVFAEQDFSMKTKAMPARIARQNQVVFAQTGDYVGFTSNGKGVMMRQGHICYDRNETSTMAFFPDGSMRVFAKRDKITAEELTAQGVTDSFSFSPILVSDGELHREVTDAPPQPACLRCAIGMIEPYHFISVVSSVGNGHTIPQFANIFLEYGCEVAYNLDGGNSTSMVFMGEQISQHRYNYREQVGQRALSDLLAFGVSESVPGEDEPYGRNETVNGPNA